MGLRLKSKLENFLETISDKEKARNKKLNSQIMFLRKHLGSLKINGRKGLGRELVKKYFHVQQRHDLKEER